MKSSSWLALALAGCGLVNSNTLSYDYAFDPQEFMQKMADEGTVATVPTAACDPAVSPDPCVPLQAQLPAGSPAKMQCDAVTRACAAVADIRLPYPIDLSQQNLPAPVVQYGVDKVSIKKMAYWIKKDTLNVALPPIEVYVASSAAKDLDDPSVKLIGTSAMLPARAQACADARDSDGDAASLGAAVCDVSLKSDGESALATFVKDYKTPFQLIAHLKIVAHGGDPLPVGIIDFVLRPTVTFSILK
ncbi:MAG: hypothetical protein JWN44_356 [Myxococcales bacterium]|nr:hypothetical protein [Myxococcales bacterium]